MASARAGPRGPDTDAGRVSANTARSPSREPVPRSEGYKKAYVERTQLSTVRVIDLYTGTYGLQLTLYGFTYSV